jgi:uncharacterized glyoxalase superfamily protein PhnB
MHLIPYLQFRGECEAAFKIYETCLGGKITFMMRCAEEPRRDKAEPTGWGDKIYHVTLVLGNYMLQGADVPPVVSNAVGLFFESRTPRTQGKGSASSIPWRRMEP